MGVKNNFESVLTAVETYDIAIPLTRDWRFIEILPCYKNEQTYALVCVVRW